MNGKEKVYESFATLAADISRKAAEFITPSVTEYLFNYNIMQPVSRDITVTIDADRENGYKIVNDAASYIQQAYKDYNIQCIDDDNININLKKNIDLVYYECMR